MAFFEIRQYAVRPGRMDEWIELLHQEILPFQIGRGMVVCGSFQGEEDDSVYVWIRRFESEEQRERLYDAVYNTDEWKNHFSPRVGELLDREKMVVQRVCATAMSPLQ